MDTSQSQNLSTYKAAYSNMPAFKSHKYVDFGNPESVYADYISGVCVIKVLLHLDFCYLDAVSFKKY